jgi:hypothetical protein
VLVENWYKFSRGIRRKRQKINRCKTNSICNEILIKC